MEIAETRLAALKSNSRIEIGSGAATRILKKFSESAYVTNQNLPQLLSFLCDTFYYLKTETRDKISDAELTAWMYDKFETTCQCSACHLSDECEDLYADITAANRFSRMKTMTDMILKTDLPEIDRSNYTLSLAQIMLQNQTITESEYQAFINRLFLQLGEHIKLYTSGESDSVMNETAAAILGSITYNCDLVLPRLPPNIAIKRMLNEPIESIYFDGLKINRELILKALSMIRKIKRSRIDVMCVYYNNILNNDLERLVRSYDPKFDAKRNLTDIDYKMPTLNRSVCGIGGILHMLEELQTENNFVNSFPREMTSRLFKKYLRELAHPAGDMINLGQLCFEHSILSLMAGENTTSQARKFPKNFFAAIKAPTEKIRRSLIYILYFKDKFSEAFRSVEIRSRRIDL